MCTQSCIKVLRIRLCRMFQFNYLEIICSEHCLSPFLAPLLLDCMMPVIHTLLQQNHANYYKAFKNLCSINYNGDFSNSCLSQLKNESIKCSNLLACSCARFIVHSIPSLWYGRFWCVALVSIHNDSVICVSKEPTKLIRNPSSVYDRLHRKDGRRIAVAQKELLSPETSKKQTMKNYHSDLHRQHFQRMKAKL